MWTRNNDDTPFRCPCCGEPSDLPVSRYGCEDCQYGRADEMHALAQDLEMMDAERRATDKDRE